MLNLIQETSVRCHLLKWTRLHVLGPGRERLKYWQCMSTFVIQSVSKKLGRGSHTAGLFKHTVIFGTVLGNSPLQQEGVAGHYVSLFLQEARREVQASGKVKEQETGALILLQKLQLWALWRVGMSQGWNVLIPVPLCALGQDAPEGRRVMSSPREHADLQGVFFLIVVVCLWSHSLLVCCNLYALC